MSTQQSIIQRLRTADKLTKRKLTLHTPKELGDSVCQKIINYYKHDVPIGDIARRLSIQYRDLNISAIEIYLLLYYELAAKRVKQRKSFINRNEILIRDFKRIYELWIKGFKPSEIQTEVHTSNPLAIQVLLKAFYTRNRSTQNATASLSHIAEAELTDFLTALRPAIVNEELGYFIPQKKLPLKILHALYESQSIGLNENEIEDSELQQLEDIVTTNPLPINTDNELVAFFPRGGHLKEQLVDQNEELDPLIINEKAQFKTEKLSREEIKKDEEELLNALDEAELIPSKQNTKRQPVLTEDQKNDALTNLFGN